MELFAEIVQLFGVPNSVGQIYGLLYASPAPLSFSNIIELLDISKGSASQGLQLLRSLGAICVTGPKFKELGDMQKSEGNAAHREYYEPELSLRKLVGGILNRQVAPFAAIGAKRLNRLLALTGHGDQENKFYLERAKQLNTWRRQLKTVLPVLSALLGPKSRK